MNKPPANIPTGAGPETDTMANNSDMERVEKVTELKKVPVKEGEIKVSLKDNFISKGKVNSPNMDEDSGNNGPIGKEKESYCSIMEVDLEDNGSKVEATSTEVKSTQDNDVGVFLDPKGKGVLCDNSSNFSKGKAKAKGWKRVFRNKKDEEQQMEIVNKPISGAKHTINFEEED